MKHLLKYKIFENLSSEELDRLLDKINKSGMDSLTWEEKQKLKSFNGEFENPYDNKDKEQKSEVNKLTNFDTFNEKLRHDNIIMLHTSDKLMIGIDRFLQGSRRVYFIIFKEVKDQKSRASCIKIVYNLNNIEGQNFKVYDNHNTEIEFNKLKNLLHSNNINYETFNNAFYYVEENYINR